MTKYQYISVYQKISEEMCKDYDKYGRRKKFIFLYVDLVRDLFLATSNFFKESSEFKSEEYIGKKACDLCFSFGTIQIYCTDNKFDCYLLGKEALLYDEFQRNSKND